MRLIEVVDFREKVYFLPLGDVHLGAKGVDIVKLKGYINWIKENPAYTFLLGDIFDTATIDSPTSPFEQEMNINDAYNYAIELFYPIKKKIVGAIIGNHELRIRKYAGFDIMQSLCKFLNIPYCEYSAVVRFRIGKYIRKNKSVSPNIEYIFFLHHGIGSTDTIGGKANKVKKLSDIFIGADAYIIGHSHAKFPYEDKFFYLSKSGNGKANIKEKRVLFVIAGSFLKYDGTYAEQKMLKPAVEGAIRIRMNGEKKDLHIAQ